jgi:hypothetical protein
MKRLAFLLAFAAGAGLGAGPLEIVNAVISQEEGGASLAQGFRHVPGEILFFSFQVQGYQATPDQKIRLRYRVDALDPQGVKLVETVEKTIEATLSPEDKEWKPKVRVELPVPPLATSGSYQFAVTVTDELAHTTARKSVAFEVRGRDVAPSDTLVVRNFRFYRSEEATEPLEKAAYRPGDSVWARFDITGYKFGPGNQVNVSYGIEVLEAGGKQLWAKPDAAVEQSQSFYPKRFVPGSMGLNLQPNIRPGEYTIVVKAHDGVGNQDCEARGAFNVE